MGRDFRRLLAGVPCWNRRTQAIYEHLGVPLHDVALQSRGELAGLCALIERERVRSYLEIGVWTGRVITALHELFDFELVAAADLGAAEALGLPLRLPFGVDFFHGDSHSAAFVAWRQALGPIDLVLIDADHGYEGVRADWELARRSQCGLIAFHDIVGDDPATAGVRRLWREIRGEKIEIVAPNDELGQRESTMGIGVVRGPFPRPEDAPA